MYSPKTLFVNTVAYGIGDWLPAMAISHDGFYILFVMQNKTPDQVAQEAVEGSKELEFGSPWELEEYFRSFHRHVADKISEINFVLLCNQKLLGL